MVIRDRARDRQRGPAPPDERERRGRTDGGSAGGKWHRVVAVVRSGRGASRGNSRSSARRIYGADSVDDGASTRGSCWHSASAVSAYVPEGTLFPRAAMGQGTLTPIGP